jgi:hypothetical protein
MEVGRGQRGERKRTLEPVSLPLSLRTSLSIPHIPQLDARIVSTRNELIPPRETDLAREYDRVVCLPLMNEAEGGVPPLNRTVGGTGEEGAREG